jgi:hypothetical protein
MTPSLASTTWDDFHHPPAPKLREPENPKLFDIINTKVKGEFLEVLYYLEGQGKEILDRFFISDVASWAIKQRYIFQVYELPVYDQESDEEYMVVYPPTSEYGTAEEINANRLRLFLSGMTNEIAEHLLRSKIFSAL